MLKDFLKKFISHDNLGWREFDEEFVRFNLIKVKWFNLYLHWVSAPIEVPACHDHPWWFVTLLLWPGYIEYNDGKNHRRYPGMILYRPAEHSHRVHTPFGPSWSLVVTGPWHREWSVHECLGSSTI